MAVIRKSGLFWAHLVKYLRVVLMSQLSCFQFHHVTISRDYSPYQSDHTLSEVPPHSTRNIPVSKSRRFLTGGGLRGDESEDESMNDELAELLEELHSRGYDSISSNKDRNRPEASGNIPLPKEHRREPQTGWRRFFPLFYCGSDSSLVPSEVRSVVEGNGWTVQPMGRDDSTVLVIISERGV